MLRGFLGFLFLVLYAFLTNEFALSQQYYGWTTKLDTVEGGGNTESFADMALDSLGNSIVCGGNSSNLDIQDRTGVHTDSYGGNWHGAFITKLNKNGLRQWSRLWGVQGGDDLCQGVTTDSSDNILIAGYFSLTADMDGTTTADSRTSIGGFDVSLTKYDRDGNYLWSRVFGSMGNDIGKSVVTDPTGNIFITGTYSGLTDFNNDGGVDFKSAVGSTDVFITKYLPNGGYGWTITIGGTGADEVSRIAIDASNNLIIVGRYSGTSNFHGSGGTSNKTSAGGVDAYVASYSATGSLNWVHSIGGAFTDSAEGVATDASGNVYLTGYFSGSVDFDDSAASDIMSAIGSTDIFITKLSSNGSYAWTKTLGSEGADSGRDIGLLSNGNLVIGGSYSQSLDFDPGLGTTMFTSSGSNDAFWLSLDNSGSFVGVRVWGGAGNEGSYGLGTGSNGMLVLGGTFTMETDFDPSVSANSLAVTGTVALFVSEFDDTPRHTLSGRVRDVLNGTSIASATITSDSWGTVNSDIDGNYQIRYVPRDTSLSLTASHSNYNIAPISLTIIDDTAQDLLGTLKVFDISGTVTMNSAAVEGVLIDGGSLGQQFTNSSGFYTFSDVDIGTAYVLTPSKNGASFSPQSVSGNLAGDVTKNFTASPTTHTISGTILSNGSPLSGVLVDGGSLGTQSTNASGVFSFSSVPFGSSYTINPYHSGYTFNPDRTSGIIAGDVNSDFTATPRSFSIRGSIVLDGKPIVGVRVTAEPFGSATTGVDGSFEIVGVPYGSTYTLSFYKEGIVFETQSNSSGQVDEDVEIRVAAEKAYYSICGHAYLADINTSPLSGVVISNGQTSAVTGADGAYCFEHLDNGTYEINAQKEGYFFRPAENNVTINLSNRSGIDFLSQKAISTIAYAPWNSYLGMTNILEVMNLEDELQHVTINFRDINGKRLNSFTANVPPLSQRDFILNDISGYVKDTYGMIDISTSGRLDGRMSIYLSNTTDYDFAYTIPLLSAIQGNSYINFDTRQPSDVSNEKKNLVPNWLTIVNLDSHTAHSFVVSRYEAEGNIVYYRNVVVPPLGRRDIDGGHVLPGEDRYGYSEISPDSLIAPYQVFQVRYGSNAPASSSPSRYYFSSSNLASSVSSSPIYLPISEMGGVDNSTLLSNVGSTTASINIEVRTFTGEIYLKTEKVLRAKQTLSFDFSTFLDKNSTGLVCVTPSSDSEIIAESEFFFRDEFTGQLFTTYITPGKSVSGIELSGSYNLFLRAYNWLRLTNITNSEVVATLRLRRFDGEIFDKTVKLKAYSGADQPLHDYQTFSTSPNTYGTVQIIPSKPGGVYSEIVRIVPDSSGTPRFAWSTVMR